MLSEICAELNNYFILDEESDIHIGTFTIAEGTVDESFLVEDRYFRIVGSSLNDGVYCHPAEDLEDESFEGALWTMHVPAAVIALDEEITAWCAKYEGGSLSPYTSESFGGYSYSKGTSTSTSSYTWQSVFAAKLKPYRKMRCI